MSTAGAAQDPTPISAVMRSIIKSVMSNDVEGVQQALEEGHNIDQFQGPNGMTMLHVAAGSGAADVTRLLIESGMDPLAPNKDGVTPLDMARHAGHPTVATMIENAIRDASEDHLEEVFERLTLQAVVSNDTTNIRQALDAGLRDELFDWRGPNGETYLHLAAHSGSLDVVKLLVAVGFDPGVTMDDGVTPLDIASVKGHDTIAKLLMQAKHAAKPSQAPTASSKETVQTATQLIVQAVLGNDVANIRMALDKGLNIQNIHGPNGETLLHLAAEHGHTDMVTVLLEAGVDPLAEMTNGMTATEVAVHSKHPDTARLLLAAEKKVGEAAQEAYQQAIARQSAQQGASAPTQVPPAPAAPTEAPASPSGEPRALDLSERHLWGTPVDDLYGYWKPGQSRTMARLRKTFGGAKAEPESSATAASAAPQASAAPATAAQPTATFPPLTPAQERFKAAIINGDVEALRDQVAGGFPINDQVFAGSAALHVAAADGKTHVVRALLSLGADLNAPDQQGNTALLYAIGNRRTETAIHLAQIDGIDVNHQTPTRYTALHAAVQANVPLVVPYLLAKGADTTLTNRDGQTALQFAEAVKRDDIVVALRNAPEPVKADPAAPAPAQAHLEHDEEDDSEGGITQEQFEWHNGLIAAIREGDLAQVKALATKGTTFLYDDTGRGALHVACAAGDTEIVKHLLDVGADPDALVTIRDTDYTALDIATTQGNQEVVALLREAMGEEESEDEDQHDAQEQGDASANHDVSTEAEMDAMRAIGAAVEAGDTERLEQVIDGYPTGQQIFVGDGNTILHIAANRGNAANVLLLLAKGADPFHRNHRGQRAIDVVPDNFHGKHTALHLALAMGEEHRFPFPAMVPTFRDEAIEKGVSFEHLQVLKAQHEAADRFDLDPHWVLDAFEERRLAIARAAAATMNYDVSMFDLKKSDTQLHFFTLLVAAAEWVARVGRQVLRNEREHQETERSEAKAARRIAFRRAVSGIQTRLALHPYSFPTFSQSQENREGVGKLIQFLANVDPKGDIEDTSAALSILWSSWDMAQSYLLAQARAIGEGKEMLPYLTEEDFRRLHAKYEDLDSTRDRGNFYPRDADLETFTALSHVVSLLHRHPNLVKPLPAHTSNTPDVEVLQDAKAWMQQIAPFRSVHEVVEIDVRKMSLAQGELSFTEQLQHVAEETPVVQYEAYDLPGEKNNEDGKTTVWLFNGQTEKRFTDWYGSVVQAVLDAGMIPGMMHVAIV